MINDLEAIVADPCWLPHEIDPARERIRFVKLVPGQFESRSFLAEVRETRAEAWLSFDAVLALRPATAPIHFIFHSGFCRSTLLLQALRQPGCTVCLNEPGILNSLAGLDRIEQPLIDALVALLSRPHGQSEGQTILVKPSNYPNRLIPWLMRSRTDTKAIIITNDLRSFLEAVARKGMLGRQWGRQLCLTARHYAAESDGFDLDILAGLTDLQLAGLGWLYLQSWFTDRLAASEGERTAVLDSDFFNLNRRDTIAAAARYFGLRFDQATIAAITEGPVFKSHSKLGVEYGEKERLDRKRSHSAVNDEEIASVSAWIGEIARVSGLAAPVQQTLLLQAPRR